MKINADISTADSFTLYIEMPEHPYLSPLLSILSRCYFLIAVLPMLMKILLSCSHSSPDMPLRFIGIKHFTGFPGQGRIDLEEPFGDVLMYRTLADAELLCRLPHGRIILYNIFSNLDGSLLNIIFQKNPPANIVFTMYAGEGKVMHPGRILYAVILSGSFYIFLYLFYEFLRLKHLYMKRVLKRPFLHCILINSHPHSHFIFCLV